MFVHHVFILVLSSIKALSTVKIDLLSVKKIDLDKETFIVHINSMHKNKLIYLWFVSRDLLFYKNLIPWWRESPLVGCKMHLK